MRQVTVTADDMRRGAELAGTARRENRGKPGLLDGIRAAVALRLGWGVATNSVKDFVGAGVRCIRPLVPERQVPDGDV